MALERNHLIRIAIVVGTLIFFIALVMKIRAPREDGPPETLPEVTDKAEIKDFNEKFDQVVGMLESGRYEEAVLLLKALEKDGIKDNWLHYNLGYAYDGLGAYADAVIHYKQAVKLDPSDAATHANLALVYKKMGDMQASLKSYRTAVEFDPQSASIRVKLGILYHEMGEMQQAAQQFEAALQIDPSNSYAQDWLQKSQS